MAQSELSSRSLNAEYKKYQGESKRVMLSMHERTNALVCKINKEASAVKQKFGVTYPFESEVDEPEWTGLNLSLRQAPKPAKFGLDSPVPQILPRYYYPQSTPFPKNIVPPDEPPQFKQFETPYLPQVNKPVVTQQGPAPSEQQTKPVIQHNFEQPEVRESVPLYQPPRGQEAAPQHQVENPHQQPAVAQTRHAVTEFTPETGERRGDFQTMMREVVQEEFRRTMDYPRSTGYRSRKNRHYRSQRYSVTSNSTNSDDGYSFRPNSRSKYSASKSSKMQVPKMSFSGEGWRGFISQFETVADRCRWQEQEKLDNFSMCLTREAAEYFSILPETKKSSFFEMKQKFEEFFDKTEPASAIRWEILNIEQREDEPLEKYFARLQSLVMRAYPDSSQNEQDNTLFIEVFLKGCREKGAVLSICDKKPKNLEEAYKYVKSASQYRKAVLGKKGQSKKVHRIQAAKWTSSSNSSEDLDRTIEQRPLVRNVQSKQKQAPQPKHDEKPSVEAEVHELKSMFGKVLNLLQNQTNSQGYRSPPRNQGCFECGSPSHFVRQCPRRRGSPNTSPRRSDDHNWRARGDKQGASSQNWRQKDQGSKSPPSPTWRQEQGYRSPPSTTKSKLSPERANQEWKIGTPLQGQSNSQVKFNLNY